MRVTVLYFAAVRELRGLDEEPVELPDGATVAALAAELEERHGALRGRLGAVRFAVNEEFAEAGRRLSDGDVVAVIPPVAGGSPERPAASRVLLCDAPLRVDPCLDLVRRPGAGAIAAFLGTVRDHHAGRSVTGLEYTAYRSMAEREMVRIVEELEEGAAGLRLAVHHRLGDLQVGEIAVICAASSPHRGAAFEGGRRLIDEIKARVPIWKRERGPDGVAWVGWEDARVSPSGR
ncbi:MAG: molybdopterin converting factor subunit 1 [Sandaracinaceae bacterium]